jgi:alpha-beta hydrolase superfamily lysophospholipase
VASELDFRYLSAADGDGAVLVAATIEEMRELYGGLDLNAPVMPTAGAADLAPLPHRAAGPGLSGRMRALYESDGHVPIGKFNGNPVATFFGEKRLSG